MIRVLAFLSRKPGTDVAAFRDYYENKHAALIMRLNPLRGYRRHYVQAEPSMRNANQINFDVVTEMEFDSEAQMDEWFAAFASDEVASAVQEDEEKFLDTGTIRVCRVETMTL